jgi:hypothetical protein
MTLSNIPRSLLLLLFVPVPLEAQVANATMNVVVRDGTGAAVAQAKVKVTNDNTGLERTGLANQRGELLVPLLPVGQYSVSAEFAGFKMTTITAVVLQLDQTAEVQITLQPGDVHQEVEVKSEAASLDTETSSLGEVIENKNILDLPLNGRDPYALGLLTGNTTPVFGMATNLPFIAGGGRFSANEVTLDGIDNNTVAVGGSIGRAGIAFTRIGLLG